LRSKIFAINDGILPKSAPEVDGFVFFDVVDQPGGLPPSDLWFVLVADTLLDSETAENEKLTHDLMALLVDLARQEHRPRIVCGQHREFLVKKGGESRLVLGDLTVEGCSHYSFRRRKLVNGAQVRAK
jgi:hypothetical protein